MDPAERLMRERAKAMMRRRARGVRASVPASAVAERSARLAERLMSLPAVAGARRIGLFWPIERNHEVDLRPLVEPLLAAGVRLAFPRILERGDALSFAWVSNPAELEEREHGFAEPAPTAEEASTLDVVVVPALLLDARGHRLGYGAGYYDRTLPRLCPPGVAVGVAFDFQLAAEIPTLECDVPVDVIVTDARILEIAPRTELLSSDGRRTGRDEPAARG
ncbi:MAG: 5-formyltetrahydrofolate cyclo-ligase [Deltaproteobacteria bacterium]|nr:5-formyltetrahydrofolate cyclo-ligase [Deltaproteobacteria bacterium]